MADLVFTGVPGRVAKALLDLADRFGERLGEGLQVHRDLTQEELAQLVGASRETVNKALADFAARGWLRLSAKSVLLIDPDRLAKHAGKTGSAAAAAKRFVTHPWQQGALVSQVRQLGPDRPAGNGHRPRSVSTSTRATISAGLRSPAASAAAA